MDGLDWLESIAVERVVITYNVASPGQLISHLSRLEDNPHHPTVELSFPSASYRAYLGADTLGHLEYSPIDTNRFAPAETTQSAAPLKPTGDPASLVIGRHCRDTVDKFHPDDPSLMRSLQARGHRLTVLGGQTLRPYFDDSPHTAPQLLAAGSMPPEAFLAQLDCYLYQHHPHCYETGGTSILEAMSMALPVIAFGERCGSVELIRHGENGFIVDSNEQVLAIVDRLAADADYRRAIGEAARRSLIAALHAQDQRLRQFYLGAH